MWNPFRRSSRLEQRDLSGLSVPTWSEVSSGEVLVVGPASESRALSLIPVFACCRLLAGTVSTLPLKTYRDVDGEKTRAPQARLFADMDKRGELVPWLHQAMLSMLLRGNAYGEVVARDGYGFPTQIVWADPAMVRWEVKDDRQGWRIGSRLLPESDVVHIPWFTLPGRREGMSPIGAFAATIHGGLATNQYASDWFANGGIPTGTFQNTTQTLTAEQATSISSRLMAAIRGRKPLVYGADWVYNAITVAPKDAQFVEVQKLNATHIAAIYGIQPEKIGGESGSSMTYQTLEHAQIDFVMNALRPWLVKLEHAFSAILPDRQYVKFNADALIRADTKTRHEVYKISREIGLRNIDELRALEDLPFLPGGEGQDYTPAGTNLTPPGVATSGSAAVGSSTPDNVRSIDWARPA